MDQNLMWDKRWTTARARMNTWGRKPPRGTLPTNKLGPSTSSTLCHKLFCVIKLAWYHRRSHSSLEATHTQATSRIQRSMQQWVLLLPLSLMMLKWNVVVKEPRRPGPIMPSLPSLHHILTPPTNITTTREEAVSIIINLKHLHHCQ